MMKKKLMIAAIVLAALLLIALAVGLIFFREIQVSGTAILNGNTLSEPVAMRWYPLEDWRDVILPLVKSYECLGYRTNWKSDTLCRIEKDGELYYLDLEKKSFVMQPDDGRIRGNLMWYQGGVNDVIRVEGREVYVDLGVFCNIQQLTGKEYELGGSFRERTITIELFSAAPTGAAPVYHAVSGDHDGERRENISPEELEEIIDGYRARGLTLLASTAHGYAKILYSNELWVKISDNTRAYDECAIYEIPRQASPAAGALNAAEASRLLPDDAVAVLERTPEGLYETLGLQVFLCLFDRPHKEGIADPLYTTQAYLVGKNGALPFAWRELLCADLDGDGSGELIVLAPGPTSGVFTETLSVYGVADGAPVLKASNVFRMDAGLTGLKSGNGRPCFSYTPSVCSPERQEDEYGREKLYPILLEEGLVVLENCGDGIQPLGRPAQNGWFT